MVLQSKRRRGAVTVEAALIYPISFLLLLGLIIAGLGVFRYQEVASLAREGSRYASVHGDLYQQSTGQTAVTADDVYKNAILPQAVALDPAKLGHSITWSPDNKQGSTVTVRVTYHWLPEAFLGGVDLTGTSTMVISY